MRNLHQVVIDNVGEMVRRESIRLHQDKIFFHVLLLEWPVDGITKLGSTKLVALEANNVGFSSLCSAIRLSGIYRAACPVVNGGLASLVQLALLSFQLLGSAETSVGMIMVQQFVYVFMVNRQPFRLYSCQLKQCLVKSFTSTYLSVGAIWSTTVWPFVP
jgi:hypothetical protein